MKILKERKRVRRSVCQYGSLAQVSRDIKKKIGKDVELCIVKGDLMHNTINGKVNCIKDDCYLKKNMNYNDNPLYIFNNLKFTTFHQSKQDIRNISKKNNYFDILKMTWTCWYPKNGQPCGRCIMCRERII